MIMGKQSNDTIVSMIDGFPDVGTTYYVCMYVLHFLQVGRDMGFSGLSFKSNLALNIGDKVFPMDA